MAVRRYRENVSTQLNRLAELAREDRERRFFSIAHLLTAEALYCAFRKLRRRRPEWMG
jgi:hypothetical protein